MSVSDQHKLASAEPAMPPQRLPPGNNALHALPKPWQLAAGSTRWTAPLALANSIVSSWFWPPQLTFGVACVVFGLSAVFLFGNSAVYHLGRWSVKVHSVLRRIDHSNIFLLIAGTYTPLSVALLPPKTAALVLGIVWAGATGGILLSVFKPTAPRWLYTPLYVALGWVAVWFLPDFWQAGGPAVVWLLIAGGLSYTAGALCYGLRWPNPWPNVWGFHEFFHTGTLFGYVCHAVTVWLAVMA